MISISSYTDAQINSAKLYLNFEMNTVKVQQTLVENKFMYFKNDLLLAQGVNDIKLRIETLSLILNELVTYTLDMIDEDISKIDDFVYVFDTLNLKEAQKYIYLNDWTIQRFIPVIHLKQIDLVLDWRPAKIIPEDYTFNIINNSNKFTSFNSDLGEYKFVGVGPNIKSFKKKTIKGTFSVPLSSIILANVFMLDFKIGSIKFLLDDDVVGFFNFNPDIDFRGQGRGYFEKNK